MFCWQCGQCFTDTIIAMLALWKQAYMMDVNHLVPHVSLPLDTERQRDNPVAETARWLEGHRVTAWGWRGLGRKNEERWTDVGWIPWRFTTQEKSPRSKEQNRKSHTQRSFSCMLFYIVTSGSCLLVKSENVYWGFWCTHLKVHIEQRNTTVGAL